MKSLRLHHAVFIYNAKVHARNFFIALEIIVNYEMCHQALARSPFATSVPVTSVSHRLQSYTIRTIDNRSEVLLIAVCGFTILDVNSLFCCTYAAFNFKRAVFLHLPNFSLYFLIIELCCRSFLNWLQTWSESAKWQKNRIFSWFSYREKFAEWFENTYLLLFFSRPNCLYI